ncbi:molybdenum cofactor guanylyltransferase [Salinigranum marinum]|uniref:molybdenum cofactor guanylyltransferase n=1 Tax=Salinigranum marinum TaxID=1515595 RepID=UPI002989C9B9|nr:molybdenum cofactor guanylyltransferase [Salinigranum marinum]
MPADALKPDTGRAGVVLAGGRSRRFEGGDKALATLAGTALLRHAVGAVDPVVDEVVVSCRDDQTERFAAVLDGYDVSFAVDPIDGLGPVAGLQTALRETDRVTAVVTACDTPLVPSAFLGHLLDRVEGATTAGVVTEAGERVQPLPMAVNVRAAAAACTETLVDSGSLRDVIESLAPVVISERAVRAAVGADRLLDVDTRADLARAERLLAHATGPSGGSNGSRDGGEMRPNSR